MANRDNKVSPQPWVHWGISKEEFDTYKAAKAEWDKGTPAVGSDAPDFEVECLDTKGQAYRRDVSIVLDPWQTCCAADGILYVTPIS